MGWGLFSWCLDLVHLQVMVGENFGFFFSPRSIKFILNPSVQKAGLWRLMSTYRDEIDSNVKYI